MSIDSRLKRAQKAIRKRGPRQKVNILQFILGDRLWNRFWIMSPEERWTKVAERGRTFLKMFPDAPKMTRAMVEFGVCHASSKVADIRKEKKPDQCREWISVIRRQLGEIDELPEDRRERWREHLKDYLWRFRGDYESAIRHSCDREQWEFLVGIDSELNELRPDIYHLELALSRSTARLEELNRTASNSAPREFAADG